MLYTQLKESGGRVFSSLKIMQIRPNEIPLVAWAFINPCFFPELVSFHATVLDTRQHKSWHSPEVIAKLHHSGLEELDLFLEGELCKVNHCSLVAFPYLKKLRVSFRIPCRFTLPGWHNSLQEVWLSNCRLKDYNRVSPFTFPQLHRIHNVPNEGQIWMPRFGVTSIDEDNVTL